MTITATVIKVAKPKALKYCTPKTLYVSIAVNTTTGYVSTLETEDIGEAKSHFSERGSPATWRGVQIIQVDTNGGRRA